MTNWPTAPIIHVIKGSIHGSPIDGKFAVRAPHGGYGIDTHFLPQGYFGARIDEWEDVTPVPTAALKRLQQAFRGVDVIESLESPLLEVLSYLPADKPSPLGRAVTRVKEVGGPMISAETLPADRLSLLLDALASVQGATRKTAPPRHCRPHLRRLGGYGGHPRRLPGSRATKSRGAFRLNELHRPLRPRRGRDYHHA